MAAASLCATWLVFIEYLPPFQAAGFHGDLAGYHFPLFSYAWQELRQGRIPWWDPVMYCGISYAGITQEGLAYPPNWLLFAAARLGRGMTQKSLEVLLMLHLWAGFLFCFGWLRARTGSRIAASVGAAAFALGGMPLSQSQHLGVVCCYVWIPLGLWAVERARKDGSIRPWLTLSLAGAMAFLAGYPSTFLALVLCVACWAAAGARGVRDGLASAASLAFSMLLAAAQLLPTLQANLARVPEKSYSGGLPEGAFTYALLFLPNFFDSARPAMGVEAWRDYFYLGGTMVFGLGCLLASALLRRAPSALAQPLLTIGAAIVLMHNPFGLVDAVVSLWPALAGVLREYNLFPCVTVAACCLGAEGIAWLLASKPVELPRWAAPATAGLALAWCARLLWIWVPGGLEFASGWWTALDAAASAALAGGLVLAIGAGRWPRAAAALLVLLTISELKSFGTNRRFSAESGHPDKRYRALRDMRTGGHLMAGMEQSVFELLRADRWRRVIVLDGIHPIELHHYGLATPQGFEATLPRRYREKVDGYVRWRTNRTFEPDPADQRFLRDFAVGYLICRSGGPACERVAGLPHWRPLGAGGGYFFSVFEYTASQPAYRWSGTASPLEWQPGRRLFEVSSDGGKFALLEQNLAGWAARIDGREARIQPWEGAFQAIDVPAGRHRIEFHYRPHDVFLGAWISLLAAAALTAAWARSGRSRIA
jgi:hypothetical protein